jgi:hypothetical protein
MELQSPDAHSIDDEPPLNFEDILTERQRIDRVTQGLLATQDSDVLFTRTRLHELLEICFSRMMDRR